MEKLTYKKIIKLLDEFFKENDHDNAIKTFDYEDYDIDALDAIVGPIEEVNSHGGCDAGSDYWKVVYFKEHDVYLKYGGYYSSYEGTEFDGETFAECAAQVYPHEKTITIYETKKPK